MSDSSFCSQCGASLETGFQFCNQCGHKVGSVSQSQSVIRQGVRSDGLTSNKSAVTAMLLCLFLGAFGAHRFYVGKIGTGILMLLTLGGLGIWALIDLIIIASCEFTDADGKVLEFKKGNGSRSASKRVLSIFGIIIAGFLIFIGAIIIIAFLATAGLVKSVEGQLDALRAGDVPKAYAYTSSEFQKATSLEDFEKFLEQAPSLKNNKTASFPLRKFENDNGSVTAELEANDGSKTTVEYELVDEHNEWKINNIHVLPEKFPAQNNKDNIADHEKLTDALPYTMLFEYGSPTYLNE